MEDNQNSLAARGISKDISSRWFGQTEFKQKSKDDEEEGEDDEFAKQFPLPRDGLSKTKAHEKRV